MPAPRSSHDASPAELLERIQAERLGTPFVFYRDGEGKQRILRLEESASHISFGRGPRSDVCLSWDENVSRLHAELVRIGDDWALVDDGLSRNGSYLNGERVTTRRRLRDGDALRLGHTVLTFRAPADGEHSSTALSDSIPSAAELSPAQRRVLFALARPFRESNAFATPATNLEIAGELFLSVDAVKGHLRVLFEKFGVQALPQNQKRARLVERAFLAGVVTERDLSD